jgi:hypothetical protein
MNTNDLALMAEKLKLLILKFKISGNKLQQN